MDRNGQRTFVRPHRPLAVKVINAIGRQLRRLGLGRPLSSDRILKAARRKAKLTDRGDPGFRERLHRLVDSFEQDANLNSIGRAVVRQLLIHFARNRLQIQHTLQTHPEILDQPLPRPLIVAGLPRTGTTLLHNLLCQDPHCRPLRFYEAFRPVPEVDADPGKPDPRIARSARLLEVLNRWSAPDMETVHAMSAEGPEECTLLLFNTFATPAFGLLGHIPRYMDWLRSRGAEDRVSDYEDYRRQLQLLQWASGGASGHWALKAPIHLFALHALFTVLPDACVVQTHRDPCQVIPSACSLFAVMVGIFSDDVAPEQIGPEIARGTWRDLLEPAMTARAAHPGRVHDVHYRDLMNDPIGTVRSIYQYFGYEMAPVMEERMQRWLADNPVRKHGAHRYDLEQFGLSRDEMDALFEPYRKQFGIVAESAVVPAVS